MYTLFEEVIIMADRRGFAEGVRGAAINQDATEAIPEAVCLSFLLHFNVTFALLFPPYCLGEWICRNYKYQCFPG